MEVINLLLGFIGQPEWSPLLDVIYQIAFFVGQFLSTFLLLV